MQHDLIGLGEDMMALRGRSVWALPRLTTRGSQVRFSVINYCVFRLFVFKFSTTNQQQHNNDLIVWLQSQWTDQVFVSEIVLLI